MANRGKKIEILDNDDNLLYPMTAANCVRFGNTGDLVGDTLENVLFDVGDLKTGLTNLGNEVSEARNSKTTRYPNLKTRLDAIEDNIGTGGGGASPFEKEVEDARTDKNGMVHGSLGDRLNNDYTTLNDKFDEYLPLVGGTLSGSLVIDKRNAQNNDHNLTLVATPLNMSLIEFSNNQGVPQGNIGYMDGRLQIDSGNTRLRGSYVGFGSGNITAYEMDFYLNDNENKANRAGSIRVESANDGADLRGTLHLRFANAIVTHSGRFIPILDASGQIGSQTERFSRGYFADSVNSHSLRLQNVGFTLNNPTYTNITAISDGVINIKDNANASDSGGVSFGDGGNYITRKAGGMLEYKSSRHTFEGNIHFKEQVNMASGVRLNFDDGGSIQSMVGQIHIAPLNEATGARLIMQNDTASTIPCVRPNGNTTYLGHQAHPFVATYTTQGNITVSDKRLKENIEYLDVQAIGAESKSENYSTKAYDFIKDLRFAKYNLKENVDVEEFTVDFESGEISNRTSLGFIAQDIAETEVGKNILYHNDEDSPLMYSETEYINTIALALQNSIREIESLKTKNDDLEERVKQLEEMVTKLTA